MLTWIKSLFFQQKPTSEKEIITMSLTTMEYNSVKCKMHQEYQGSTIPTNNCNTCWDYYSKVNRNKW